MTRRPSEREIEKIIEKLEAGGDGGDGPSIVFAERLPRGERRYHTGADRRTVGEQAAAEAAVVIGTTPAVEQVIDEETLEATHAHPIDPTTGETVEKIILDGETHEFLGVDGDADAVVREHPALFVSDDDASNDADAADDGGEQGDRDLDEPGE